MAPINANRLLAAPAGVGVRGRRWLAGELARAICERAGLTGRGGHVGLLRDLLMDAWSTGASPTLDELLDRSLSGFGNPPPDVMPARLALALRLVEVAPEFGGDVQAHPAFAARALAARAAVALA